MALASRVEGERVDTIVELLRLESPAPRPQSLAFDGSVLWMGSRTTRRIYAIEPATWTVREETTAPGTPWGMTVVGDELRVLCGETDEDNRIVRRFIPGHGFKSQDALPCPDDTGSQLSYDGDRLYVSQWYNERILSLDDEGNVGSTIEVGHQIIERVLPHPHRRTRREARHRDDRSRRLSGTRPRVRRRTLLDEPSRSRPHRCLRRRRDRLRISGRAG